MRFDPAYEKISRHFMQNPVQFADAFARAWFKLTHRDMGPRARYLGKLVPKEVLIWQDPLPAVDHPLIVDQDVAALKAKVLASGLTISQLVSTAWASASTFRGGDKRGGANGARIRLAPQKEWEVNQPIELSMVLSRLEAISKEFNAGQTGGKKVSLADLIVLAGNAAVEAAAKKAGQDVVVPFAPGRTDASQAQTDVDSFAPLESRADGFRNYLRGGLQASATELLIDKARLLTLSAPEMTVLVGGLRVLGANFGKSRHGVFTQRPENALQRLLRQLAGHAHDVAALCGMTPCSKGWIAARARPSGRARTVEPRLRLELAAARAGRVYASSDAQAPFVHDFVAAWAKVMNSIDSTSRGAELVIDSHAWPSRHFRQAAHCDRADDLERAIQTWLAQHRTALLNVGVIRSSSRCRRTSKPKRSMGMALYSAKAVLAGRGGDVLEMIEQTSSERSLEDGSAFIDPCRTAAPAASSGEDYQFGPQDQPTFPGGPYTPSHPPMRRLGYAAVGILDRRDGDAGERGRHRQRLEPLGRVRCLRRRAQLVPGYIRRGELLRQHDDGQGARPVQRAQRDAVLLVAYVLVAALQFVVPGFATEAIVRFVSAWPPPGWSRWASSI